MTQTPSFAAMHFAGEDMALGRCGALWWPRLATLVVADLHLEKASWFATGGQMLPPYDSHATLAKLDAAMAATGAARVVCLGDSFHDEAGAARLEPAAAALLATLEVRAEFVWIAGNHDAANGGAAQSIGGIAMVHQACPHGQSPELSGHFHPKLALSARGRRITRPCAVRAGARMIMPAYGAFTGGLHAHAPAIRAALHPARGLEALVSAGGRLVTHPLHIGSAAAAC